MASSQICRDTGQSGHDAPQLLSESRQAWRHRRRCQPHLQPQRDQPLLGAVVQVALRAAATLVGGRDDAGA
jgi:hypothetical protein